MEKESKSKIKGLGKLSKRAKVFWGIVLGLVVLVIAVKVYDANRPIDPLANVQNVEILTNADGDREYCLTPKDADNVATQMRIALIKKYGGKNKEAIQAVEKNPKWYYASSDYEPVIKAIGQKRTDKIIDELDKLKDSISYHYEDNKLTVYLDVSPDLAKKDGIKLVNRTFTMQNNN